MSIFILVSSKKVKLFSPYNIFFFILVFTLSWPILIDEVAHLSPPHHSHMAPSQLTCRIYFHVSTTLHPHPILWRLKSYLSHFLLHLDFLIININIFVKKNNNINIPRIEAYMAYATSWAYAIKKMTFWASH